MQQFDVVIIGGGASGLMCAALAAQRGRSVVVLEKAKQAGRKILMSGGGRCNFTNMDVTPKEFISNNPHFCKSALKRYTQWDFIGKVLEYGIDYHERDLGKLFCDDSAKDILQLLLNECDKAGAQVLTQQDVQKVSKPAHDGEPFFITTQKSTFQCQSLVVASGGLSIPSMGANGIGYELAEQFGLQVLPRRAGLVPFTFSDDTKAICEALAGNAIDCEVYVLEGGKRKRHLPSFTEPVLFTHRGLSGPAILQLSNYWQLGESIALNLLPYDKALDFLLEAKANKSQQLLRSILAKYLPKNLVLELEQRYWLADAEKPLLQFSDKRINDIAQLIHAWHIKPSGTEGYRTAEVTLGGVDSDELSSKTLQSNKQQGLFFIGEVVDVTGHLGGYNFQWAWSSAYAAAQFV